MSTSISFAKFSGVLSYTVSPASFRRGIPAFGLAMIGISVTKDIALITSAICAGPVEQLAPTPSTPSEDNTTAAVRASVPNKLLPSFSKVMVAKIGKSQTSLIAITAALVS